MYFQIQHCGLHPALYKKARSFTAPMLIFRFFKNFSVILQKTTCIFL